jgi:multidrug transporter EmrE-like cation transporter
MHYFFLALAIVGEVIGTTALKSTEGFTKLGPSAVVTAAYVVAFYALSLTLERIPVGVVYAVWSGVGTILIALLGWALHGQRVDVWGGIGFALIIGGVVVLNTLSRMEVH